ncbi:unnamed protein product [Lota lota]
MIAVTGVRAAEPEFSGVWQHPVQSGTRTQLPLDWNYPALHDEYGADAPQKPLCVRVSGDHSPSATASRGGGKWQRRARAKRRRKTPKLVQHNGPCK